jgi:hypothetical protein
MQAVHADACDQAAMAQAVLRAEHLFGGVDAVIAAAGVIAGGGPAWEVPIAQEEAVLAVDLGGVLTAARVGIPALLRRPPPRSGRFIAVASAAATRGLPMLAAYCAASRRRRTGTRARGPSCAAPESRRTLSRQDRPTRRFWPKVLASTTCPARNHSLRNNRSSGFWSPTRLPGCSCGWRAKTPAV